MINHWKNLDPSDGFFAKVQQTGEVSAHLIFGVSLGGRESQVAAVETIEWPTAQDIGALKRKLIVLEAVAEYMNAGGDPADLDFLKNFRGPATFCFQGWNYFDGGTNTNGNRVHEFISDDSTKFVRWVRNEYIDTDLTLEQISDDSGVRPSSDTSHVDQYDTDAPG
jgi:hypothetical protein